MTPDRQSIGPSDDVKEMVIAGCPVRLAYRLVGDGLWTVEGSVACGTKENRKEQSVMTEARTSREEAERDAVTKITALLGQQIDRSNSRVHNWS